MKRLLSACALAFLLAGRASAALLGAPPAGDDPTPPGYLLVKFQETQRVTLMPPDVDQHHRTLAFQPFGLQYPAIFANYAGQQFWTDQPEFCAQISRPFLHPCVIADLGPELDAQLPQVLVVFGAYTLWADEIAATVTAEGYEREAVFTISDVPESAGCELAATGAALVMFSLTSRPGRRQQ